jgi:hypothetical protein
MKIEELNELLEVLNNFEYELYEFRAENGIASASQQVIEDVEIAIANAINKLNSTK